MSYNEQNPKSYYNHAGYSSPTGALGGEGSRTSGLQPSRTIDKAFDGTSPYDNARFCSASNIERADRQSVMAPPPLNNPPVQRQSRPEEFPAYGTIIAQPGFHNPPPFFTNRQTLPAPQRQPAPSSSWNNPHIPRDWAHDNQKQARLQQPFSQQPLQVVRPYGPGDNNDNEDRGCCSKWWFRNIILCILIWLVFLKYSDWLQWINSSCRECVEWADTPALVMIEENVSLDILGRVTNGYVHVHRSHSQRGEIHTKVRASSENLAKTFKSTVGRSESTTKLQIELPSEIEWHEKIEVEVDIWLPSVSAGKQLHVDVPNMEIQVLDAFENVDWFELKSTNAAIRLKQYWSGRRLVLQTTNGPIQAEKPAVADELLSWKTKNAAILGTSITGLASVELSTANGPVIITKLLAAENDVTVFSKNGRIQIDNVKTRVARIKTVNASVKLPSVNAMDVLVQSSNGRIEADLNGSMEDSQFVIATSNAPVRVFAGGLTGTSPRLTAQTSNASINVEVKSTFAGTFSVQTSKGKIARVLNMSKLNDPEFYESEPEYKRGLFTKEAGNIVICTSHSDGNLTFLD